MNSHPARSRHLVEVDSFLGSSHHVEAILGSGSFGVVAKCRNINTNQSVAVKVTKPTPRVFRLVRTEIENLKRLRCLEPETSNIIGWDGFFFQKTSICLTFELLDLSVTDYMCSREEPELPLTEVRSVIGQMATALSHLSSVGIVHADIKPENIMVVDRNEKPIRVKLIDFGLSFPVSECQPDKCVGTVPYIAPEMLLGCPFDEAIDMWSLGQTAVEMVTGSMMYPGGTPEDVIRFIVETQGQPEDHILDQGLETEEYFSAQNDGSRRWQLRPPEDEFAEDSREYILESLDDLGEMMGEMELHRQHSRHQISQFVDLIKKMLSLDPEQRIKPQEVLQHPFMTEDLSQTDVIDDICDDEVVSADEEQLLEDEAEELEDQDIMIQLKNPSPTEEPEEDEESQEEWKIQPEERQEKVGLFGKVFEFVLNAFDFRRRSRRRPRTYLETSV